MVDILPCLAHAFAGEGRRRRQALPSSLPSATCMCHLSSCLQAAGRSRQANSPSLPTSSVKEENELRKKKAAEGWNEGRTWPLVLRRSPLPHCLEGRQAAGKKHYLCLPAHRRQVTTGIICLGRRQQATTLTPPCHIWWKAGRLKKTGRQKEKEQALFSFRQGKRAGRNCFWAGGREAGCGGGSGRPTSLPLPLPCPPSLTMPPLPLPSQGKNCLQRGEAFGEGHCLPACLVPWGRKKAGIPSSWPASFLLTPSFILPIPQTALYLLCGKGTGRRAEGGRQGQARQNWRHTFELVPSWCLPLERKKEKVQTLYVVLKSMPTEGRQAGRRTFDSGSEKEEALPDTACKEAGKRKISM